MIISLMAVSLTYDCTVHLKFTLLFEPLPEPYPLNDLNAEECPPHSNPLVAATSDVTDENVFVDSDTDENDPTSNKVKDAEGACIM